MSHISALLPALQVNLEALLSLVELLPRIVDLPQHLCVGVRFRVSLVKLSFSHSYLAQQLNGFKNANTLRQKSLSKREELFLSLMRILLSSFKQVYCFISVSGTELSSFIHEVVLFLLSVASYNRLKHFYFYIIKTLSHSLKQQLACFSCAFNSCCFFHASCSYEYYVFFRSSKYLRSDRMLSSAWLAKSRSQSSLDYFCVVLLCLFYYVNYSSPGSSAADHS